MLKWKGNILIEMLIRQFSLFGLVLGRIIYFWKNIPNVFDTNRWATHNLKHSTFDFSVGKKRYCINSNFFAIMLLSYCQKYICVSVQYWEIYKKGISFRALHLNLKALKSVVTLLSVDRETFLLKICNKDVNRDEQKNQ